MNIIYIRTIKHYTDIDPTVDFVFPVNKLDRENSGKNSFFEKFEATKCVFRSCNLWKLSKELNMFLLPRTTVLCTVVYRNIMKLSFIPSVVASCNSNNFFRYQDFQSAEIKCLMFSPKPQKFHTAEISGYTVVNY
jgi:hypothetical protein